MTDQLLDFPAFHSLTGPHARFAERRGNALRYPEGVSSFVAVPPVPNAQDWVDLAALTGPNTVILLTGGDVAVPDGWDVEVRGRGVQLVDAGVDAAPDPDAVRLGSADVPEMLDLVERAKPGPFLPRTIELGAYLGVRVDGALVAMAGERMHPQGFTEISAVCTDEAFRGRGYAGRLIRAVAFGIRERGETPFLHAASDNTKAIRLYESVGFELRRTITRLVMRVPAAAQTTMSLASVGV